ncbi:MAG: pantoate--beta-alanine ligase [Flavobacteriaceae bacterium]|nr:pantoate--beta-alanine ligase [Flavobacteriaceae bacterium]
MKVFKTIDSIQNYLSINDKNKSLGFVPTMGALHKGHLSIVNKAKNENSIVIVSIFVNPTQFNNTDDLNKYPITLENDLKMLETEHCDIVFVPSVNEIYSKSIKSDDFDFDGLDKVMEGEFREGHFDGVGTIVKKLFEIIQPDYAYFGEKDFQQLQIIRKMVEKNNLPVKIIGCEIYREDDGLAMSSRNTRLSAKQRNEAPLIYKTLLKAVKLFPEKDIDFVKNMVKKVFETNDTLVLEYIEIADIETLNPALIKNKDNKYRAFIAVFAGEIRLIDNVALN